MHQLELFTDKKLGFKYRKRLYNDNQNYMYTAIPTEQGYKLVPVSIYLKGEQLFYHFCREDPHLYAKRRWGDESAPDKVGR